MQTKPRLILISAWIGAVLVGAIQALAIPFRLDNDRLADLHVYYGATSELVRDGKLYSFVAANGDLFTYPPFAGLLLSPLTLVSEQAIGVIWTAICLITIFAAAYVLACQVRLSGTPSLRHPLIALMLLLSAPISSNLRLGQISWLLAVLVGMDALSVLPNRFRGIATGIAAAVKLTPLIFIPYFWLSGQRKTALVSAATFVSLTLSAWLVLPRESEVFWSTKVWQTDRIGDLAMGGNQSLNGILLRFGFEGNTKVLIWASTSLIVLGIGLWRAGVAARLGNPLLGMAIAGCVAIVVSPVSWTHHQIWLVLAGLAVLGQGLQKKLWGYMLMGIMLLSIGTAARSLAPVLSPIADNLRGYSAIAVTLFVASAAVQPPSKLDEVVQRCRSGQRRNRFRSAAIGMVTGVIVVISSGCSADSDYIERPTGQVRLAVISHGVVNTARWQTELVKQDGQICVQSVVGVKITGTDCDMKLAGEPANFIVEGNSKIVFVRGVAHMSVAKLVSVTRTNPSGVQLNMSSYEGNPDLRYFGYVADPNDVVDLVAYDSSGKSIYSGGTKILSTIEAG